MSAAIQKALCFALALLAVSAPAFGQDYPSRPVHIIVPLAAGGIADNLARALGQKITDATKQPVIIDNRPGAAGVIGTELAAKAPADGYTIFMGGPGPLTVLPYLRSNLPFDPVKDFVPIINIVTFANLLVVHPSVPANSLVELIALAKAKPGTLSFASQGTASSGHMVGEQFKLVAGLDIVHIPYKGAAPAVQDLVGGQVSMMFDSVLVSMPHVRAGRLRALAITSRERNPGAAEVPTMAEAGLPGLEAGVWFGLFAPTGTPRKIVDWWNGETRRIFSEPELANRMLMQGAALDLGSPEKFAALMASDSERWGRVIKSAGIKGE
jgi:tripartite-type tricarboxylate transporter receptor subunit TctC